MLSGLHAVPCAASSHLGTSVFLQRRFPASRPCLRNVQHKLKCSVSETAEVETQAPVYRPNNKERYQRALTKDEGIRLRKASHQMGKDICSLNIGRNGITRNTIVSLGDALAGNEIVKVKVGGGCDADLDTIRDVLTEGTDSVQIHTIGFTLTLYRDKSLPRPKSSKPIPGTAHARSQERLTPKEVIKQDRTKRIEDFRRKEASWVSGRPSQIEVVDDTPADRDSTDAQSSQGGPEGSSRDADDGGAMGRAAVALCALAASLSLCQVPAAQAAQAVAAQGPAGNAAVLRGIQKLEARGGVPEGTEFPSTAERDIGAIQKVQQQLRRIGILAGSGEYTSARKALREGPTGRLRKTLREAEGDFGSVSDNMVKSTQKSLESLDGALKQQQPQQVQELEQATIASLDSITSAISSAK
mmetsp:Transcript_4042/g.11713  ORF Transcript_4042/g.11713 Transcript_4042/m.11713 type:complete len:414 (+) Transcript_4042:64-1305(+)